MRCGGRGLEGDTRFWRFETKQSKQKRRIETERERVDKEGNPCETKRRERETEGRATK